MPRRLSETDEAAIRIIAREAGQPLAAVRIAYAEKQEQTIAKKVRHYALLKQRRPDIAEIEIKLAKNISRTAEQLGLTPEEATAVVVLGHLSMKRGIARLRRKRKKTETSDPWADKIIDELIG